MMGYDIRIIGKAESIEEAVLEEYCNKGISLLKEHFEIPDDNYQLVETLRKYGYDRSYLSFCFMGEDTNYDVIYQRDARGVDKNISTYLIESVGRDGMITKICQENGDESVFDIPGKDENLEIRNKVVGILEELDTTKQLFD